MVDFRRTHTCGDLREGDIGKNVILSGWIHKHRNFGGLLFIDIRDRYGITQVVVDLQQKELASAEKLRLEDVVTIHGTVVARKDANPALPTGKIELTPTKIDLLSKAEVCPFPVSDRVTEVNEEFRLKYRYLDMRRGKIVDNLIIRHKAMMATRQFLDSRGFTEVVTPVLGKSTPEGARDYLVPSRIYPGTFYALPQSPQIFKQLLMVGGLDKYFQIAICFRDEDSRADRQPEFGQIDIEMSFATEEELFPIIEQLARTIFATKNLASQPFRRMKHAECMDTYGTDKPDLRYGMQLISLNEIARASTFQVFHTALQSGGIVKGICIAKGAELSRKAIDEYTDFVKPFGLSGLVWIKLQNGAFTSSAAKFFTEVQQKELIAQLEMHEGDLALIAAGQPKQVHQGLDHLRRKIAKERNLIDQERYEFLWVTDFPLFAYNEEEGCLESEHHPFTSPNFDDIHLLETEPLKMRSASYDLVLNGYEIASGSQRIHDSALQDKIFTALGLTPEERHERFGFFVEALRYGTPPHIGIALGFDRLCMILAGTENMRDVIAFPKTQRAQDLMMDAPSIVADKQLKELHITSTIPVHK